MRTVEQLLHVKGSDIWSIAPQETAYRALQIMAEKNVGALLVMEDEKLVGIFSERDYARKVILKDKSSKNTSVSELMTREVVYIDADATLEKSMAVMTAVSSGARRVRAPPFAGGRAPCAASPTYLPLCFLARFAAIAFGLVKLKPTPA